ncbi:MAG TPA: ABC transporter permease [Bacillota bacterium]|nr:ABC transporter permease [Bacillota bacterium]HOH10431.1 ABC transporter permease [Bacillota bacterium]HOY88940.1 ABC transporter permease [Bacillota bacterium]HPI01047.1 ABC transporter permease [Bacillota bacterium]HPM63144.1 ABC transporter permease [Bacillota bacterium]
MWKFTFRRLVSAVVTIFLIASLTFLLMNIIPGSPFNSEKGLPPQIIEALKAKYGLDKPLFEQYVTYMKNVAKFDFGPTIKYKGRTVNEIIRDKFPISAKVGALSLGLALAIGIPLGSLAALNHEKIGDRLIMLFTTFGIAVPGFVIGTLLLITFGVIFPILPTFGLDSWKNYIMPSIALSLYPTCYITRLTRSSMLDVISQDYIRTAKAKGLNKFIVIGKHALKNSILPVVTYVGPLTAYVLTGGFVVEKIFTIPGLGKFFIDSINARDYPMIMGTTIFLASFIIIMNFVVDVLYPLIDPRIKIR